MVVGDDEIGRNFHDIERRDADKRTADCTAQPQPLSSSCIPSRIWATLLSMQSNLQLLPDSAPSARRAQP